MCFYCLNLSVLFKNTFFCLMKPRFCLSIDLSGIKSCNTFSVVPSVIHEENTKTCCSMECQYAVSLRWVSWRPYLCRVGYMSVCQMFLDQKTRHHLDVAVLLSLISIVDFVIGHERIQ